MNKLLYLLVIAIGLVGVTSVAAVQTITFEWDEIPIQIHKMPLEYQQMYVDMPSNFEQSYSILVGQGLINGSPGDIDRILYYKVSDQAFGIDFPGSNTPGAFCDVSQPVTNQTQLCGQIVSDGKAVQGALTGFIITSMIQASEYHDVQEAKGNEKYTRWNSVNAELFMPKEINHNMSFLCEANADTNPLLAGFDIPAFRDAFKNGMHPDGKQQVYNHMTNGIVKNQAGEIQYLADGITPQKIHMENIHVDCLP